jgi:hypothetical protein
MMVLQFEGDVMQSSCLGVLEPEELKQEKLCTQAKHSVPNGEGCTGTIWLKDTKAGRLHYITLKLENHHVN